MPSLPTGRLTRKQIRDLACRRAGNSSLSDTDAVTYLQLLLDELYQQHPWPFLHKTQTGIVILGLTFALPDDFLASQDDAALRIDVYDGMTLNHPLQERDRQSFELATEPQAAGGMPDWWNADRQTGLASVWPDPSGHVLTASLRYKYQPASQVTSAGALSTEPTDVPIFPYHNVLVQKLYATILFYEGDQRANDQWMLGEKMLENVLGSSNPLRSSQPVIPLDPEVFGTPFRSD